jgi:hypothetical protein
MNIFKATWNALTGSNLQPSYLSPEGGLDLAPEPRKSPGKLRSHLRLCKDPHGLAPSGFGVGSPATEGAGPLEPEVERTVESMQTTLLVIERAQAELRTAYDAVQDAAELMGLVQVHLRGKRVPNIDVVNGLRKTASAIYLGLQIIDTTVQGGKDALEAEGGQ